MDSLDGVGTVVHEPDPALASSTNVAQFMAAHDIDDVDALRERSTTDLDWFWGELPEYLGLEFFEDYDAVRDDTDDPQSTAWYPGAELNVAHNTVDRHASVDAGTRNHVACIWEGEDGTVRQQTYHDLHQQANRVANALAERGIGEGDTVGLYMPMVPEVQSILYGIFKIGAIAVPVFSGFGVEATATRIADAECSVVFTGDGFLRRGDRVTLMDTLNDAIERAGHVDHTIVYDRLGIPADSLSWTPRDEWWDDAVATQSPRFETHSMAASDPCMLLYSSGTTGTPKGIVHTHAGALVQPAKEIHFGFDQRPGDRFCWVSDIGWMMGPWSLIGNHAFAGTIVMYEGAPDHPAPDRFWQLIEDHGITQFGVSPTAIRALRDHGDEHVAGHDLSSLRILGSTGEPWDPESWRWFYDHVGGGDTPIINISGGTEVFGCFLMPLPTESLKPCTLGGPGLGMDIDIVDDDGTSVRDAHERGYLVARSSSPSMTRRLWSGEDRYLEAYWSRFEDVWNHGDWAQMDADGDWFLHGRADDAINVAGRKVGPAEVEGALIDHDAVTQAAVVGVPDDTTGEAAIAYVILADAATPSAELRAELRDHVGDAHGKPFRPREVVFVDDLPKTQSGKLVRRAVASAYTGADVTDRSSIENPAVLDALRDAT